MAKTRLLFVYGTLLAEAKDALGRHERARLARESRRIGAATTKGRLYDLGGYPGLVPSTPGSPVTSVQDRVSGEVVELLAPHQTFAWLDAYEGVTRVHDGCGAAMHAAGDAGPDLEGGHGDEYRRAVIPVAIGHDSDAQGEAREAWAYLYIGPLDRLRRIDGGHWTMRGA